MQLYRPASRLSQLKHILNTMLIAKTMVSHLQAYHRFGLIRKKVVIAHMHSNNGELSGLSLLAYHCSFDKAVALSLISNWEQYNLM